MKIHSHFISIDGEVNKWGQGVPSVFLRLQNCNLRCSYCDIPEAQDPKGGRVLSVDQIVEIIRGYECEKITITGGEPLLQEDEIHELLNRGWRFGIPSRLADVFSPPVLNLFLDLALAFVTAWLILKLVDFIKKFAVGFFGKKRKLLNDI